MEFIQKKYFCSLYYIPINVSGIMRKSASLLFWLASVVSVVSCTKEVSRESPLQGQTDNSSFYATIDGQPWQADSVRQTVIAGGELTLTGISGAGDAIAIVLPGFQTGIYDLNAQSAGYAVFLNLGDTSSLYLSNSGSTAGGTVTLTSIDTINHTISGTFQFNLYQPADPTAKAVTAGVFNDIPYGGGGSTGTNPTQPPPATGSSDTLQAKVDGADWNATDVVIQSQSGLLGIAGISGQQSLVIFMPANITAGTYAMDFNSGMYFGAYSTDAADPTKVLLAIGNGSLTILENDVTNRRMRGTFSFTAKSQTNSNSATVTNGYFAANY
jgi:hypothetical protein